jgi:tartrate dehydrogenase/decarboxylase/D-malate dehydrogenase
VLQVERALDALRHRGVGTPDLGGRHTTTGVADALLDAVDPLATPVAGW